MEEYREELTNNTQMRCSWAGEHYVSTDISTHILHLFSSSWESTEQGGDKMADQWSRAERHSTGVEGMEAMLWEASSGRITVWGPGWSREQ